MEFVIDEELRALIPPLSKVEFENLEQNILEYGCLDPLIVWPVPDSDEIILLDGHSRFKICSEHNVSYKTESISLIDRAAAINWMIMNQFGRRNLSTKQASYLRGKQYHQQKQKVTNPYGLNGRLGKIDESQDDPQQFSLGSQPPQTTAGKLAKEHGVAEGTITRDARYAEAVDAIVTATAAEVQQPILVVDSKLTKSATLKLADLAKKEPEVVMEILEKVQSASNQTAATAIVESFISEIQEIPAPKLAARLTDFDTVAEGVKWLLGRFTASEILEWVAQNLVDEKGETRGEKDSDEG